MIGMIRARTPLCDTQPVWINTSLDIALHCIYESAFLAMSEFIFVVGREEGFMHQKLPPSTTHKLTLSDTLRTPACILLLLRAIGAGVVYDDEYNGLWR